MSNTKKTAILAVAWVILPVVIGLLFYNFMVGPSSTSVFSIIFGWQWFFLIVIGVYLIFKAWREKSKRVLLTAAVLLLGVTATFIPAYLSNLYGLHHDPNQRVGPQIDCWSWDNQTMEPAACFSMSIPAFTQGWIDHTGNESEYHTESFYLALILNELTLFAFAYGGMALWLSNYKTLNKKPSPKT